MADVQIPPRKIPNKTRTAHIFLSEYPLISTTVLDQITRNRQKNVLRRTKKETYFRVYDVTFKTGNYHLKHRIRASHVMKTDEKKEAIEQLN